MKRKTDRKAMAVKIRQQVADPTNDLTPEQRAEGRRLATNLLAVERMARRRSERSKATTSSSPA